MELKLSPVTQPITVFTKYHAFFCFCQFEIQYTPDIADRILKRIVGSERNPVAANLSEGMHNILIRFPEVIMDSVNALLSGHRNGSIKYCIRAFLRHFEKGIRIILR